MDTAFDIRKPDLVMRFTLFRNNKLLGKINSQKLYSVE